MIIKYCCDDMAYEMGISIQHWNDKGEKDISDIRLGHEGREYRTWSDSINYCPFCGAKAGGSDSNKKIIFGGGGTESN